MGEDDIGQLSRWREPNKNEYHVGWSDEFGSTAVCGEEFDFVKEWDLVAVESEEAGRRFVMCSECARAVRNLAKEAGDD